MQEKINALQAYRRLPQYRLEQVDGGQVIGNIIVNSKGNHNPLDHHAGFEKRIENYLIGGNSYHISQPKKIEQARSETLSILSSVFNKQGNRDFDIVPRHRRMDERQIDMLNDWLQPLSK